jgi:hypothetical protein
MENGVPASRCFVVCGKAVTVSTSSNAGQLLDGRKGSSASARPNSASIAVHLQAEELQAAFAPYGAVESVKVIREKGGESLGVRPGSTRKQGLFIPPRTAMIWQFLPASADATASGL